MFRVGLKREEKEMIIRTINELQELRAELSMFKSALAAGMVSADRERPPWAPEESSEGQGPGETLGEGLDEGSGDQSGDQCVQKGSGGTDGLEGAEAALLMEGACPGPDLAVQPEKEDPTAGEGSARVGEEEGPVGGPPAEGGDPARDWAVVRLGPVRRPWWRFWYSGQKATRRNV